MSTRRTRKTEWSAEEDAFIRENWPTLTGRKIADALGLDAARVHRRVRQLGLANSARSARNQPPLALWLKVAREEAAKARVRPCDVIGGTLWRGGRKGRGPVVQARWNAWRRIKDEHPHYSMNGIAIVAGFDHSSLVHAFKQMALAHLNQPSG